MYNETIRADGRDFLCIIFITLAAAVLLWLVRKFIHNILLCDILTFTAIGMIAYNVLTGYCSEFSYSAGEEELRFSRKISSRLISETVLKEDIIGIYHQKPNERYTTVKMCRTFKRSGLSYILYKSNDGSEKMICFEGTESFLGKLKELGYKFV